MGNSSSQKSIESLLKTSIAEETDILLNKKDSIPEEHLKGDSSRLKSYRIRRIVEKEDHKSYLDKSESPTDPTEIVVSTNTNNIIAI